MAMYKNGIETKRRLIEVAYKRLVARDAESLKIRDLASESGCSAATVYQHFESLEYLLTVASIRLLDSYSLEYSRMLDSDQSVKTAYLNAWLLFIEHVFRYPDVFYRLFWDSSSDDLENAIQDYYEMFPLQAPDNLTAQYYMVFFGGSVVERDSVLLRSAVGMGYITEDDMSYLALTNSSIVGNMLHMSIDMSVEDCKEQMRLCERLVRRNTSFIFGEDD